MQPQYSVYGIRELELRYVFVDRVKRKFSEYEYGNLNMIWHLNDKTVA